MTKKYYQMINLFKTITEVIDRLKALYVIDRQQQLKCNVN